MTSNSKELIDELCEALEGLLVGNHSFTDDRDHWVHEREAGNGFASTILAAIDALAKARATQSPVEGGR